MDSVAPISISAVKAARPFEPGPMTNGDPCALVVFGAAGDLARRKLIPAVYSLARKGLLAKETVIVGVGVEALDDEKFRAMAEEALAKSSEVGNIDLDAWLRMKERMFWVTGNLTEKSVYETLNRKLAGLEAPIAVRDRNRLFYLAVPPAIFVPIVELLSSSGLAPRTGRDARPWRRVIVEKPFGRSLATSHELSQKVLATFDEHQVYRIDHYVGKETVQNILVFRSANAIFEALWRREFVSHVQITAAETVGLEGRARYYESAGVVRDMFQNHLLQLVALTAMEPPETPSADAIRDEKVKVLKSIKPLVVGGKASAVRAQYGAGMIDGKPLCGYLDEPDVAKSSVTPTYAAIKFEIDNERWRGVPFYVRSGKRLAKRHSEVAIFFRAPKHKMYEPCPEEQLHPNAIILRVQPNDGIAIGFEVKIPGAALALTPGIEIAPVEMDFSYENAFGSEQHPAYETLILDGMIGDATLFTRTDEVEAAWKVIDPLLEHWEQSGESSIPKYAAGSWGPDEGEAMLKKDGFGWRTP